MNISLLIVNFHNPNWYELIMSFAKNVYDKCQLIQYVKFITPTVMCVGVCVVEDI
jgi:hypothetical protein